jgi:hypothetical protein
MGETAGDAMSLETVLWSSENYSCAIAVRQRSLAVAARSGLISPEIGNAADLLDWLPAAGK